MRRGGGSYTCPGCSAVIHRDMNGACNFSRACHGTYGEVQARTLMYLQPL
jgi:transposase